MINKKVVEIVESQRKGTMIFHMEYEAKYKQIQCTVSKPILNSKNIIIIY